LLKSKRVKENPSWGGVVFLEKNQLGFTTVTLPQRGCALGVVNRMFRILATRLNIIKKKVKKSPRFCDRYSFTEGVCNGGSQ